VKVPVERKKLHEKFHNIYSPPNIIRMNKSRRVILVRHAECIGEIRSADKASIGKPDGKRPFGGLGIDEKNACEYVV
jgi:hypothetical protein